MSTIYNSVATDPAKSCLHVCKLMWSNVSLAPKPEKGGEGERSWFQLFMHALNYVCLNQWEGANDAFEATNG